MILQYDQFQAVSAVLNLVFLNVGISVLYVLFAVNLDNNTNQN